MADDREWMREHPKSVWTGGGVPSKMMGVPPPPALEEWGETWRDASDDYLIGLAARVYGNEAAAAMPALIESNRRLRTAIASFEERSMASDQQLIGAEQQLLNTIERFNTQADRQATRMMWLTIAMFLLAAVQTGATIAQVWLAMKGVP